MMSNDTKLSQSELQELEELRSYKSKVKDRQRRQWVKNSLYVKKAKEAGLTVSEKEIDEYISR